MTSRAAWLLMLLSATPLSAAAEVAGGGPGRPAPAESGLDHTLRRYRERLALSPDQEEQVRAILAESRKRQDEVRAGQDARIRDLLDAAQRKAFDEMGPGREPGERGGPSRGGGGHGGRGGFGGPSIDDFARHLDLTPDQRERIEPLLQESFERARARMEEVRKGGFKGMDWQRLREEMKTLFVEAAERTRPLLTPDQCAKLDELNDGPPSPHAPPSPESRAARALEALQPPAADAPALRDRLLRVASLQAELAASDRAARDAARELIKAGETADDAVAQRFGTIRRERLALEERLREAREALRLGCSPRQEADLLLLGFLP